MGSNEAAERIQIEVNKVKAEKEAENKVLAEKCSNTEKQLVEQKKFYEDKLKEAETNSKAELAQKNEQITKNQEEISKLQAGLSEEKANNDGLNDKFKQQTLKLQQEKEALN